MLCLAVVFATALPQPGLAQSNPWLGMWKLNVAKSTYAPGQAPRSSTYNFQGAGANLTNTVDTVDAAGNSTKGVNMHNYDGQPHPVSGNPSVDARSYTRADANAVISASAKAGKDYVAASGKVTFRPHEVEKFVTVKVIGDTRREYDEWFRLDLFNQSISLEGCCSLFGISTTRLLSWEIGGRQILEG